MTARIEIRSNPKGGMYVLIDGNDIASLLESVSYRADSEGLSLIVMEFMLRPGEIEIDDDRVNIRYSADTIKAIEALGWTLPKEA